MRQLWLYLCNSRSLAGFSTRSSAGGSGGGGGGFWPAIGGGAAAGGGGGGSSTSPVTLADIARACGRWPILPALLGKKQMRVLLQLGSARAVLHFSFTKLPVRYCRRRTEAQRGAFR